VCVGGGVNKGSHIPDSRILSRRGEHCTHCDADDRPPARRASQSNPSLLRLRRLLLRLLLRLLPLLLLLLLLLRHSDVRVQFRVWNWIRAIV
jgi:hypothetical protein